MQTSLRHGTLRGPAPLVAAVALALLAGCARPGAEPADAAPEKAVAPAPPAPAAPPAAKTQETTPAAALELGAAGGEPGWEVSISPNGLPEIRFRSAVVVTAGLPFWGAKWKYAGCRMNRGKASGGAIPFSGEVKNLGLKIEGSIVNDPANVLTYTWKVNAERDLRGIIGGGLEWKLRLDSPVLQAPDKEVGEPALLPGNKGWTWPAPGGEVKVEFEPAISSVHFERGKKHQIRAMFIGSSHDKGASSFTMTVSLPEGASLISAPEDRYGDEDLDGWHVDAMLWNRSPVDLSFLNHKPAGKHGFVVRKGDELAFEDGSAVRFWGGNLAAYSLFRPKNEIEEQAKRIARLGYNLMRFHHHDSTSWVSPTVIDKSLSDSRHFDKAGLDALDYWVKCLKDEGVYVWLDLHVGREFKEGDRATEHGEIATFGEITKKSKAEKKGEIKGFCFYDATVQKLMVEFQDNYLTHVNPYTGLAYKDEPAVMGLLITNENDLTHHFGNRALGDKGNPVLNGMFRERLAAFCAKTGLDAGEAGKTWEPGPSKLFLNDQEHVFNRVMLSGLEKLGIKCPVSTTNTWGGNPLFSLPALTDGGIIDVHKYEGAEFLGRDPRYLSNVASWIAAGQVHGYPVAITEWNMVTSNVPTVDRFTAPLYIASIGALQGWDAPMIYNYSQRGFERPRRRYTWSSFPDPGIHAITPAAAIMFRQGHVSGAKKTYCLKLSREQLFFEAITANTSVTIRTLAEQSKLTIGLPDAPELDWDRETKPGPDVIVVTDLHKDFIPKGRSYVESDTGELRRYWGKGIQTIDTPRTQAAQGWIGGEKIRLRFVTFDIETKKAAVAVTALDDKPIDRSEKILITVVARVVAPNGKTSWRSEPVTGLLTIVAPKAKTLVPLKADGSEGAPILTTSTESGVFEIRLTKDTGTHWYLLRK